MAKSMADDYRALGQTLGSRGADEIGAEDIEHPRARQTHHGRGAERTEGDGRKDKVLDAARTASGEPAEADSEEEDEHEAQPEIRNRLAYQRGEAGRDVDHGSSSEGGEH